MTNPTATAATKMYSSETEPDRNSRTMTTNATVDPRSPPRTRGQQRRLIVDTDTGFDDLVGIQCLQAENIHLVTTVNGNNPPLASYEAIRLLLPQLPVSPPSMQDIEASNHAKNLPPWISYFRSTFEAFVNTHEKNGTLLKSQKQQGDYNVREINSVTTHDAVRNLLLDSDDDTVDILCLGPLTNLASWVKLLPTDLFLQKVSTIWILGGNHPCCCGTSHDTNNEDDDQNEKQETEPEFNFSQDLEAVQTIFVTFKGLLHDKIRLVPADETGRDKLPSLRFLETIQSAAAASISGSNNNNSNADDKETKSKNLLAHSILAVDPTYTLCYDPVCCFLYSSSTSNDNDTSGSHFRAATWTREALTMDERTGKLLLLKNDPSLAAQAQVQRNGDPCNRSNADGQQQGIWVAKDIDWDAYRDWILDKIQHGG